MGSWAFRAEEALATLVADRLDRPVERVLIGGLSMGFTLRAARAAFPSSTAVIVAELVPQVLAWAGGVLKDIVGDSLADPRVTVESAQPDDIFTDRLTSFALDVETVRVHGGGDTCDPPHVIWLIRKRD